MIFIANWQFVLQLLAETRDDTRSACRRHEQPRLISDDLGKTALRLVPAEPRPRPTRPAQAADAIDYTQRSRTMAQRLDYEKIAPGGVKALGGSPPPACDPGKAR